MLGTVSIEKNELLSSLLKAANIPHQVLNAKNNEREASIISKAGEKGSVTLATNIAGRGTDIVLGEGVVDRGGLFVLGSERHESRRIDNQLRGRSGRQGDPGVTQFFVSTEDDLMRVFGGERIASLMGRLKVDEETPIENRLIDVYKRQPIILALKYLLGCYNILTWQDINNGEVNHTNLVKHSPINLVVVKLRIL